jgi:hypothetical protein
MKPHPDRQFAGPRKNDDETVQPDNSADTLQDSKYRLSAAGFDDK